MKRSNKIVGIILVGIIIFGIGLILPSPILQSVKQDYILKLMFNEQYEQFNISVSLDIYAYVLDENESFRFWNGELFYIHIFNRERTWGSSISEYDYYPLKAGDYYISIRNEKAITFYLVFQINKPNFDPIERNEYPTY